MIQSWMYHSNLAAQTAALLARSTTPVAWNIRAAPTNYASQPRLTAFVIWLNGRLSHVPACIVHNSQMGARSHRELLGFGGDRWHIVPNGFDTEAFIPSEDARRRVRVELELSAETVLISMTGRYHRV